MTGVFQVKGCILASMLLAMFAVSIGGGVAAANDPDQTGGEVATETVEALNQAERNMTRNLSDGYVDRFAGQIVRQTMTLGEAAVKAGITFGHDYPLLSRPVQLVSGLSAFGVLLWPLARAHP